MLKPSENSFLLSILYLLLNANEKISCTFRIYEFASVRRKPASFARTSQISTTSSHTLEKKHRVKFTNQDSSNSLIEEADLGIDEDHSGGDINDKLLPSKTFTGNYSLLSDWYLTFLTNHF